MQSVPYKQAISSPQRDSTTAPIQNQIEPKREKKRKALKSTPLKKKYKIEKLFKELLHVSGQLASSLRTETSSSISSHTVHEPTRNPHQDRIFNEGIHKVNVRNRGRERERNIRGRDKRERGNRKGRVIGSSKREAKVTSTRSPHDGTPNTPFCLF